MAGREGGRGRAGCLSLSDLCDLAYALQLETLERWVLSQHQAALIARALGAEVEVPSYDEAVRTLDDYLNAAPRLLSPEQAAKQRERREWLQVMGLGGEV